MSRRGVVTKIVSAQQIEVDGTPWHVRSVRHRYDASPPMASDNDDVCDDDVPLTVSPAPPPDTEPPDPVAVRPVAAGSDTAVAGDDAECEGSSARRSGRNRRPTDVYGNSVPEDILDEILE